MKKFIPDASQQALIDYKDGYALVLAAPGCGKTEILSHRVLKAHTEYGVPYSDMLCVTFTNRACRDMKKRILETIGESPDDLYIGNLHRFCIRFLYDNSIVPIDTGLMDDTDQLDYICEVLNKEQPAYWEVSGILNTAGAIREEELAIPQNLRIYEKDVRYLNYAQNYLIFLKENKLMDFDDILFKAYIALTDLNKRSEYVKTSYSWIQVDEVQDLNPLQFAIIDALTSSTNPTVVYLGDERQAIYSFLGAKHNCIVELENKCNGNVIHLSNNYRAPMYLLDMLNDFATEVVKIDADRLPNTTNQTYLDNALTCVKCDNTFEQNKVIAALVRTIYSDDNLESVGILVKTNKDADELSEALADLKIKHLKITNKDMFKMVDFKTLHNHFSVVALDTCFSEWARILYQTRTIGKMSEARRCVRKMRELAITPRDLLDYENSTYFIEYVNSIQNKEIVVFDTETTGLDIFNDDIIQIAACKIKNGKVVENSELDIIIETDKPIPATLKDGLVNPMVEEYKKRKIGIRDHSYEYFMTPQEALDFFIKYIGNAELLGHNSNFDIHILESNIKRRTKGLNYTTPAFWDTLRLARLLDPNLRSHTLENLLNVYQLPGTNSHNAIDDVLATCNVALHCYMRCVTVTDSQRKFFEHPVLKDIQRKLRRNYLPIYLHSKAKLYSQTVSDENTFDFEFRYIYETLLEKKYIKPIKQFDYMCALFDKVVIDHNRDIYFYQQLCNHLYEFRTFNEADLFQNGIITERIHIMTIHKSKGLEFDSVFIPNVSHGVFPHYNSRKPDEDARVLYVAMSRASQRIFITYKDNISEFIDKHDKVKEHFYFMGDVQKQRILSFDEKFVKFL
jgi:DNA helicase-2/ATP-dependent DNA helicase PcrA